PVCAARSVWSPSEPEPDLVDMGAPPHVGEPNSKPSMPPAANAPMQDRSATNPPASRSLKPPVRAETPYEKAAMAPSALATTITAIARATWELLLLGCRIISHAFCRTPAIVLNIAASHRAGKTAPIHSVGRRSRFRKAEPNPRHGE